MTFKFSYCFNNSTYCIAYFRAYFILSVLEINSGWFKSAPMTLSICGLNDMLNPRLITTMSGKSNTTYLQCNEIPIGNASLWDQRYIFRVQLHTWPSWWQIRMWNRALMLRDTKYFYRLYRASDHCMGTSARKETWIKWCSLPAVEKVSSVAHHSRFLLTMAIKITPA